MRKIVANWDNLADPQEAMRFTVATILAERTLLEAYEQSSAANKDQQFAKSLNNRKNVYQIANSEKFNDFYTSMKTEEILKLCECKPEDFKAVQDSFYNKFVNHKQEDPLKKQNVEVKSDSELKQQNNIKQENKESKSKNQIVQTDAIDFSL